MSAIADDLGVNRVTLHRWFGSRDQFVVEVLWSLARLAFDTVDARISTRGAERIVELVSGFLDLVIADRGMATRQRDSGEHATRLFTRHEPGFQPRLIAAIEARLDEEADGAGASCPSTTTSSPTSSCD